MKTRGQNFFNYLGSNTGKNLRFLLVDRMVSEAELGSFHCVILLSKLDVRKLHKEGFILLEKGKNSTFPRIYKIAWFHANVTYVDSIYTLDESDDKYSLSQKLWIISMKHFHVRKE